MSDTAEQSAPSVEVGRRAAQRAERRLLIDGELRAAMSGDEFDNVSPATGRVLGTTAAAGAADMDAAVAAARSAFDDTDWAGNRALRKRCLEQLQSALEGETDDLREELVAEVGCPIVTTRDAQLDWPLDGALRWPARTIDEFEWERVLDGGGLFGERNVRTVVREPVGVVAAITPSNYPVEVILNKLGPALAMGNTVILKPDPNTPWNATRLGRLIAEHTDIPPGVVNVVPTPANDVAARLVLDPRVDMVSFTGSAAVGKQITRDGAETMCVHAGQACASTTRLLIHRSLYDESVAAIRMAFEAVPVGDPALPETFCGPVVSAAQKKRVLDACDRARRDGAEILTGGGVVENLPEYLGGGHFVAPTLIVGADPGSAIAQEEIFGPVLVVIPFADDDEAVRLANGTAFGLAGAVLSGALDRGLAVARRIRTGAIGVNGGMFYGADAPFGGYKSSGIGRQCGLEGLQQYTETRTVAHRTPRPTQ